MFDCVIKNSFNDKRIVMKLKMKLTQADSFMKVRVWQKYEIVKAWSHSDWSVCLDLPSMVTVTWKAVNFFTIMDDNWSERHPPSHWFDLTPLRKRKMWKLERIIAEEFFTWETKKKIASLWMKLSEKIRLKKKELADLECSYESISEAVELWDIAQIESIFELVD